VALRAWRVPRVWQGVVAWAAWAARTPAVPAWPAPHLAAQPVQPVQQAPAGRAVVPLAEQVSAAATSEAQVERPVLRVPELVARRSRALVATPFQVVRAPESPEPPELRRQEAAARSRVERAR
jgi:hypothetical protein